MSLQERALGAFSRDNRWIAFVEDNPPNKAEITVWDTDNAARRIRSTYNTAQRIMFSADGQQLIVAGELLDIVDLASDAMPINTLAPHEVTRCRAIDISPDGTFLAVATTDGAVTVWDLDSATRVARKYFKRWVPNLFFSATNDELVGINGDNVWTWNFTEPSSVVAVDGYRQLFLDSLDVHPHNGTVAFAGIDRQLLVWDSQLDKTARYGSQEAPVIATALSPDGKLAALGDAHGNIEVWNLSTNLQLFRANHSATSNADHREACIALEFSPDSRSLVSGGIGFICMWDVPNGKRLWREDVISEYMMSLQFDQHGRLYTASSPYMQPGTVRIWDVSADGPMLLHSLPHPVVLTVLAISPDQHRLAAADLRDIQLYDLTHFPPVKVASLGPHDSRIASLSFSPDSKILLSGSIRGITMWDVETDQELQHRRVGADVHAAEIISSGRQLGFLIGSHLEASPRGGRVSMQWIDQQEVDDYWMNRQAAISTTDD